MTVTVVSIMFGWVLSGSTLGAGRFGKSSAFGTYRGSLNRAGASGKRPTRGWIIVRLFVAGTVHLPSGWSFLTKMDKRFKSCVYLLIEGNIIPIGSRTDCLSRMVIRASYRGGRSGRLRQTRCDRYTSVLGSLGKPRVSRLREIGKRNRIDSHPLSMRDSPHRSTYGWISTRNLAHNRDYLCPSCMGCRPLSSLHAHCSMQPQQSPSRAEEKPLL